MLQKAETPSCILRAWEPDRIHASVYSTFFDQMGRSASLMAPVGGVSGDTHLTGPILYQSVVLNTGTVLSRRGS